MPEINVIKDQDGGGMTAYHVAAMKGKLNVMKWLENHRDFDKDTMNPCFQTAIAVAIAHYQLEVLQHFEEAHGIDFSIKLI